MTKQYSIDKVQRTGMLPKDYLASYIAHLTEKIAKFEQDWKGRRFASLDESTMDLDEQEEAEYEQQDFLEKYRGKNGDIKPLGLILYKKYLRSLLVLFLALTLLYVPVMMVYSVGAGLQKFETSKSFSKTILLLSIANLPHYRLDDLSPEDMFEISFHRYLVLSTDLIAIVIVFSFLIYLKIVKARISNEYMAKSPAPNLYCLEVEGIQGCSWEGLFRHFSKFGKVAQVSAVHSHRNIVLELRKIVKQVTYLRMLKPDEYKYEELVEKIRAQYLQLADTYFQMPQPIIKSAFVVFDKIADRNRVCELYKYEINPTKLDMKITLKKQHARGGLLFQQRTHSELKVSGDKQGYQMSLNSHRGQGNMMWKTIRPKVRKNRFEPLTINWQNCDIDKKSQSLKFACQFLLLAVVAFVILLGLFLLNINSTHLKQQFNYVKTDASSNQGNLIGQTERLQRYTFCASLSLSQFKWQHTSLCAEYFHLQRNRFIIMLSFALMVSVINLLTNRILWALVAFRRYRTLADRNSFLITSIFVFSVINSAVLLLLVRGQNTGPILRNIVGRIFDFPEDVMAVTVYSQFNRKWYMNIGSQLMMNFVVSLVVFPNFHIVLHWVRSKYRQFVASRTRKTPKKPALNYCTFYAMSLKAIFFSLMYSNCMPVFYLLGCLAICVQLVVGRVLLANFVDEPVFVDNNAIQVTLNLIPYSLLLHCLTSILFLNVEEIFPTELSYYNIYNSWTQTNLLKFQRGIAYIVAFLLISVYIWNQQRFDKLVVGYWLGRSQTKAECDQTMRFRDIRHNPAFLASYRMKDNPKYRVLWYALAMFTKHMESIRAHGGVNSIGEGGSSMNTSRLFASEMASQVTLPSNTQKSIHIFNQTQAEIVNPIAEKASHMEQGETEHYWAQMQQQQFQEEPQLQSDYHQLQPMR